MRLIDADTLNFTCTADEDYKCQKIVDCNCCPFHTITSFEIENEPTVQAIPIDVLDKIRAEIESQTLGTNPYKNEGLYEAIHIIDKYKAESEDKA